MSDANTWTGRYDPRDPSTWPCLPPYSARDAYRDWIFGNPHTGHGRLARKESTANACRGYVGGLLKLLHDRGPAALVTELSESLLRYKSEGHAPSYQRIAAWREFVAFIQCAERSGDAAMWRLPLRYREHQTEVGDLVSPYLIGHAIRVLTARIPPHTLSSMSIVRAMELVEGKPCTATPKHAKQFPGVLPGLWSDEARNALAYIIRWGWEAAVYKRGPEASYSGASASHPLVPALPDVPGSHTGMRPVVIADVAGREEPFMLLPVQPPPATIFYWRDRHLFARRAAPRKEQLEPTYEVLKKVMDDQNKERLLKLKRRVEPSAEPETPEAEAVVTEREEAQTPAEAEEWNGTKEWKLNLSVAGVRAPGERPVEHAPKLVKTGPGLFDLGFESPQIPD